MMTLHHKFVEHVPDVMEPNILYVSIPYCTAMHLCVCGCGNEVVTPISPVDWQLKFNGKTISLSPSIGNWNFECRSHYWIIDNKVKYSGNWSDEKVASGRADERRRKDKYFGEVSAKTKGGITMKSKKKKKSRFQRFKSFFSFFNF
ncbi:DUF6527 family protein [Mucilaginibacter defluvii]|uniref:DUF6527 family protein n=1 Tax=Mucilaginibacter defluvii TaxID=1196019 RepID=UPI0031EB1802